MRRCLLILFLASLTAADANAQSTKHFSLGAGVGFHHYTDSRLKAKELDIVPMWRISRGIGENGWDWDLKGSFGLSGVEIPTDEFGEEVQLGKLRTIRLLGGIARSYRHGPLKVGTYVAAGPSFNQFEIDDRVRAAYQAAGSNLDDVDVSPSLAFKPGVSTSLRLSSLLAMQASMSYTVNRPKVTTRIDGVSNSTTWKLDGWSGRVGMVLGLF